MRGERLFTTTETERMARAVVEEMSMSSLTFLSLEASSDQNRTTKALMQYQTAMI